jgi:hypothetical protein
MNIPKNLPDLEIQYLKELVNILHGHFDDNIIGIYLFGSGSYGGYDHGKSDLDIQVVVKKSLCITERKKLVNLISHKNLACPARKLEFVCYPLSAVKPVLRTPKFDINYNTGALEKEHVCFSSDDEPSHWFLLDIAIGRELGHSLLGPAPGKIFGEVPKKWILEAMLDCIVWYEQHESTSVDLILNTCRCWKFSETNHMCSKQDGLSWAIQMPCSPEFLNLITKNYVSGLSLKLSDTFKFINMVKESLLKAIKQ